MPDVPEMKRFWSLFDSRLRPMLQGEREIPATLEQIGARLRQHAQMQTVRRRFYPTAEMAVAADSVTRE